MDPVTIAAWIRLGGELVSIGVPLVQVVTAIRGAWGTELSEEQLQAITAQVRADAESRKARRQAEVDGIGPV